MRSLPRWLVRVLTHAVNGLTRLRRRIIPRQLAVLELATGSWVACAVAAFCELQLPQALAGEPRSAQELATDGYGDATMIFRLLRALCAYGVVRSVGRDRFALGRLGEALRSDDLAGSVRYVNAPWHLQPYAQLAAAIRTGENSFRRVHGAAMFDYYAQHDDAGKLFDAAMRGMTTIHVQAFVDAYDFSAMREVVDVGGGTGLLLTRVLEAHPALRGTVFEVPAVAARVATNDRLRAAPGDMRGDALPAADAYILSHVLHDWDDESCAHILRNIRSAMLPHARLLLHELVAQPPNNRWSQDRLSDLEMLVMLPGRERTRDEFATLLRSSGLQLARVIPTASAESILEARLQPD